MIRFHGICDISAVAALDDQTLLAASDEENRLFSYTPDGGDPIAARGLNRLLSLPRNSDEIDIEAAAQGAGRIWWLGSHQPFRPRRNMIFATNVPNPDLADLAIVVPPFDLTRLLQSSPATRGLWHPTTWLEDPEDGGLNVEAAAVAPNGELLIGLRAPLDGPEGLSGAAIVLALSPDDPPTISKVHRIDLGDRGLRGMASVKDGYLLIAGPIDDEAASDVLFWRPGLPPEIIPIPDLSHLNPEAILTMPGGNLIFSDDGSLRRPGEGGKLSRCKKLQKDSPSYAQSRAIWMR